MKDLQSFRERKERLASALSIVGSIVTPELRPLVLLRLRRGTSEDPNGGTSAKSAEHGLSWIVPTALIGSILCGVAGLLFLLDAERPEKTVAWCLIAATIILGLLAFAFPKRAARAHGSRIASRTDGNASPADGTQSEADRLAAAFRETVAPLAAELRMTIHLDNLEGLLGELKTYEEFGRDLEDFHVTN